MLRTFLCAACIIGFSRILTVTFNTVYSLVVLVSQHIQLLSCLILPQKIKMLIVIFVHAYMCKYIIQYLVTIITIA